MGDNAFKNTFQSLLCCRCDNQMTYGIHQSKI